MKSLNRKILFLLFIGAIFALPFGVKAATNTWQGSTNTNCSTSTANWSQGRLPIAGDDVVFASTANTIHWDSGCPATVNSLSLNAGFTGVLIVDTVYSGAGFSLFTITNNLTISSGTLKHGTNTTAETYLLKISVGGNMTLTAPGTINVDGLGYSGGGTNANGYGPGKGIFNSYWGGGGGYGGAGGLGGSVANTGGPANGSLTNPIDIGSGAGGGNGGAGGSGGGAVYLNVTGTFTNNGTISANGNAATTNGGGGSGGGIYIIAGTITGTATLQANGASIGGYGGGGGGGGRIAIYYTTDSSSSWTKNAAYGVGGSGSPKGTNGTAGTIYTFNIPAPVAGSTVWTGLATDGKCSTAGNWNNGIPTISTDVTFSAPNQTIHWDTGCPATVKSLTLTSGFTSGILIVDTAYSGFTVFNITNDLSVSAGTITHNQNTTAQTYYLKMAVGGNMTLTSPGTINVNYLGFAAGNTAAAGNGTGKGSYGAADFGGGGGGYGGAGGATKTVNDGGTTYGSLTNPVDIGSGGAGGNGSPAGGYGGGSVILSVSGTFTNNSTITANGSSGANNGGSSSGGSINITAGVIAGTATLQANGGATGGTNGGGGGGGRIAINYIATSATWTSAVTGGSGGSGQYVAKPGLVGTVYTSQALNSITATVSGSTATLGATINNIGTSLTDTGMCWSTSLADITSHCQSSGSNNTTISMQASGLSPATLYYYEAYATVGGSTGYSAPGTFASSGWFSTGGTWTYRKAITVSNANIGSNLAYFPLLVKITNDADVKNALSSGYDVRFTDVTGVTILPYERESWSGGGGSNATGIFWVQVPVISSSASTIIYMYYGNSSANTDWTAATSTIANCTSITNAQCTWYENGVGNFKGMWHLPNGTVLSAIDSTSNALNGTISGAAVATGKVDGGASFNLGAQYTQKIQVSTNIGLDGYSGMTISAWVNTAARRSGYYTGFVTKWDNNVSGLSYFLGADTAGNIGFIVRTSGGQTQTYSTTIPSTAVWHYITGVYDGANAYAYVDNVNVKSYPVTGTVAAASANVCMGCYDPSTNNTNTSFNGYLDEVRISGTARSADWERFEYCNMMGTTSSACTVAAGGYQANEFSLGSQQIANAAPSFTAGPSDGSSSATTPSNAGTTVTFTATATDAESNNYYFGVCRTNSVTANNNTAPTCGGGNWCISGSTASGAQATCTYQTASASAYSNDWYGFVCDYNASSSCSAASQSTGDTGSPFIVNHSPAFTVASVATNPIAVNSQQTFNTTASDPDSAGSDTVTFYACKSNDFTGSACGTAGEWCHSSASASNPSCNYTIQASDGLGTKNYFGYVVDNHGFASTTNPKSGTFTISGTGSASYVRLSGNIKMKGILK